jgi:hypothetical protein
MCQNQTEDWRHVIKCPSLDAALHRADLWGQLRKGLQRWKLPVEFWTSVEKGTQSYIYDQKKEKYRVFPTTPFPATLNRQRNTLKSAYQTQSKIGWENFTKVRIAEEWIQSIETHYANQGYTLKARHWLSAPYGNIYNGYGNSETISTMLTPTDTL